MSPSDAPQLSERPPGEIITFLYRNHRGRIALRSVVPVAIRYGSYTLPGKDEPEDLCWLLDAWCLTKNAMRSFKLANLNSMTG